MVSFGFSWAPWEKPSECRRPITSADASGSSVTSDSFVGPVEYFYGRRECMGVCMAMGVAK